MASKRQIEANRKNRAKRQGITPEGREQLRKAALRNRPWEHSTGPRTQAGERRSRENAVFLGQHCRTVEPFASIDRLKRLLARQAYHQARKALITQRLLAMHPDAIDAVELGKLPAIGVSGLPGGNAAFEEIAEMLEEIASLVEAIEEEEPLRQQAWRRVAALFEMPIGDVVPPAGPFGSEASNADPSEGEQAPSTAPPTDHSSPEFPTDLALCDRLIQHVASRPVTLASIAVAGLFEQIVNAILWPGIAGLGLWDRTYQRMARRDG